MTWTTELAPICDCTPPCPPCHVVIFVPRDDRGGDDVPGLEFRPGCDVERACDLAAGLGARVAFTCPTAPDLRGGAQ